MLTLLLYFGSRHWNKALTLYDSLGEIPEKLKAYVNDYKVNLFEIAWLSDKQVEMFQSDFRIVADYFVQMRKNQNYVPSEIQFTHVREVMQMMSVLTKDSRFEEACGRAEEGVEIKNMCEVLDRVENRGRQEGMREGIQAGRIYEYIDIRREDGYSEEEITRGIIKKFGLTEEQAGEYRNGMVKNLSI